MVIVLGPAFSQKLLVVISVYNLTFCSSFHGRSHTEFLLPLHNRLHILIRDRLDDIPIFIEHKNVAQTGASALLSVIQRVLAFAFVAIDRANAFSLENFPTVVFLPARTTRRPDLNDSCASLKLR